MNISILNLKANEMSNKKQILPAFFIPLFLAIGLLLLRIFVFYDPYESWFGNDLKFSPYEEYDIPEQLRIFSLFIFLLFVLSFALPFFVMMRTYQGRRNKLGSPSIFE